MAAPPGHTHPKAWLFQYASQNPLFVSLSPLTSVDIVHPEVVVTSENWKELEDNDARHRFCVDIRLCASADTMLPHDPALVSVLEGLCFTGELFAQTRFDAVPLQRFLDDLPEAMRPNASGAERASSEGKTQESLIQELPWLSKIWTKIDRSEEPPRTEPDEAPAAGKGAADPDMDDDEVEAIYEELERRRRELAADHPSGEDFGTTLLGGRWTLRERGDSADVVQGRGRNALAKEFCARRGVPQTARFEIAQYTEANAAILARAWCHRMQYFYDLEVVSGGAAYSFAPEDCRAYVEPTELSRLCVDWAGRHKKGSDRIQALRRMFS